MKNLLVLVALCGIWTSCDHKTGSGNLVTQTRSVGSFDALSVGGGFEVEIKAGSPSKVVIEADDNIIEDIEARVDDGKLKISLNDGLSLNDAHMKVFITSDDINHISSSASAEVVALDELKSDKTIILKASSGSKITADINSPAADADASSGSDIIVKGKTRTFKAESSSGATIKASDLLSENTTAQVSSGASARVHASVALNAKASSGGNITYRGAATAVKKESSGGSIEKE